VPAKLLQRVHQTIACQRHFPRTLLFGFTAASLGAVPGRTCGNVVREKIVAEVLVGVVSIAASYRLIESWQIELRPQVVADIGFAEWTAGGVLRHAEFVALREDKLAREAESRPCAHTRLKT
jgi:ATP-dependent DNA ligase